MKWLTNEKTVALTLTPIRYLLSQISTLEEPDVFFVLSSDR